MNNEIKHYLIQFLNERLAPIELSLTSAKSDFLPIFTNFPSTFLLFLFSAIINKEIKTQNPPIQINMTYVYKYPPLC